MSRFKIHINPLSIIVCLLIAIALIQHSGYVLLFLILTSFIIHEIGHMSFGSLLGYRALLLKITPLGGCLSFDPLLRIHPEAELLIAAAGPLVNLLMVAGVFYLKILGVSHIYLDLWQRFNLMIAVLNLVPALPLDGGRICHAFLAGHFGEKAADTVEKRITIGIAVLAFLVGIYKILFQQGGIFFIILAVLSCTQVWRSQAPGLDLTWRHWQHKKRQLSEKGFLQLKPVMVEETTPILLPLQQCGSGDGLLFFVAGPDQKTRCVSEEQAWKIMIERGFKATFRETMK